MRENTNRRGRLSRRTYLKSAGAAAVGTGLAGCSGFGGGDEFPSQDIEMIVPWASGGGTDRTARQLADLVEDELETSVFVSNQTGGSGSNGFNAVANADADGYTVGVTTVEIATIAHLDIADITPDALDPIIQYNFDPASLTVHDDAEYGTIEEFVEYADQNPGEINVSNSGIGAIWHLSAAGFALEAGIDVEHIGYDGGEPATTAVVNGEVEATTASGAEVASQVLDGPLNALGVFGEDRLDLFPETPTLQEAGYDFTMGAWRGLTVPSGTDTERVETLTEAFTAVYESDEFQEFMQDNGFGLVYRDTEEFGEFMDNEFGRFEEIISDLDIE